MMKGSIAVAALVAATMVESAWASKGKTNVLDMEFTIEQTEKVTNECKGRFLDTLTQLEPMDQPGKALEDMVLHVCLDFAHFIPRKFPHLSIDLLRAELRQSINTKVTARITQTQGLPPRKVRRRGLAKRAHSERTVLLLRLRDRPDS